MPLCLLLFLFPAAGSLNLDNFQSLPAAPSATITLSTKQDYTRTLRVNNNIRIKSGKRVASEHYIPLKRAHTCKKMTKVCTVLLRTFHSFKQFKHLHTFPVLIFLNLIPILLHCKYRDCSYSYTIS